MSVLTLQTAMLAQFGGRRGHAPDDERRHRSLCVLACILHGRIYGRTRKYPSPAGRAAERGCFRCTAVHSFLKECLFMEENKEIFTYTYSARQQEEVRRIPPKLHAAPGG